MHQAVTAIRHNPRKTTTLTHCVLIPEYSPSYGDPRIELSIEIFNKVLRTGPYYIIFLVPRKGPKTIQFFFFLLTYNRAVI